MKKGDLVYLPSEITLLTMDAAGSVSDWSRVSAPTYGVMVSANHNNENIYHKVHVNGRDWLVLATDTRKVKDQ
jgi:hypothetical protein